MPGFTRNTLAVTSLEYVGTNVDAVIALVGSANVVYLQGELRVHGVTVPSGNNVVVVTATGAFVEVASDAVLAAGYTAA
jgi:hypothetical protein